MSETLDDIITAMKELVVDAFLVGPPPSRPVELHEIDLVWFSKTLQNHKAVFRSDRAANVIFEVTYNGDRVEYYIDTYLKTSNKVVPVRPKVLDHSTLFNTPYDN